MPNRRFDWHEHIKDIEGEYKAVRDAVDRLTHTAREVPHLVKSDVRKYLPTAHSNLEGTYLVRLFAAFEAALRSYDRARHRAPSRSEDASVLIDSIGGRRGQGISTVVREGRTQCAERVITGRMRTKP